RHRVRRDALPALVLERVVSGQRRSDAADPAGDADAEPLGVDGGRARLRPRLGEGVHAAAARQHRRPGRRDVPAERGGRAEPGYDDGLAPFGHAEPPAFLLTYFTTSCTVVRSF